MEEDVSDSICSSCEFKIFHTALKFLLKEKIECNRWKMEHGLNKTKKQRQFHIPYVPPLWILSILTFLKLDHPLNYAISSRQVLWIQRLCLWIFFARSPREMSDDGSLKLFFLSSKTRFIKLLMRERSVMCVWICRQKITKIKKLKNIFLPSCWETTSLSKILLHRRFIAAIKIRKIFWLGKTQRQEIAIHQDSESLL